MEVICCLNIQENQMLFEINRAAFFYIVVNLLFNIYIKGKEQNSNNPLKIGD